MVKTALANHEIADMLSRIADLLEVQNAEHFRVRAYRNGAQTVRQTEQSLAALVREQGEEALEAIPTIGQTQARLITEFVTTGRSSLLDRLRGEVSTEALFASVPGIGDELARRIVTQLDIHTLEDLETAAHDGRLGSVEGFGPRRIEGVRTSLAGMLSLLARHRKRDKVEAGELEPAGSPPIDLLLAVDAEYRRRAAAGELKTIAPRRFNPKQEAWLPIMHTEQQEWSFTAMYSNTARTHDLDKTHDWVVIYHERDGNEGQVTVVSETSGPLKGRRVVRGREVECLRFYSVSVR
ncbi:MAG: DNA-binding protein [Chloroflexi bacterium]|nr:DNA-binding protein [Chloroflexota bacterium]